ncbi:hypothetical protein GS399_06935 [Pedobacter sp. HMF7647]|uniref:Uncharacterized protein n=1 Tax=Hufsiella arboris TaxID=2695275 RepID=A0A7K1Y7Y7_9SPHI|nr:DUF6766 family protein [Hufsiella arboris]MXV50704.1 hypothetical protein [Hufsiella arboris]
MTTTKKSHHSYWYRNGLSIFFLSIFLITLGFQAVTGWKSHNQELQDGGASAIAFTTYLKTGHFISATFENFESEFLQMALYVLLTVGLRQKGSAESKKLDEKEEVDREPTPGKDKPWPVNKGGWILKIYENSLSICFFILFFASWGLHFFGSWQNHNIEQKLHHKALYSAAEFFVAPDFWFETFQNWQSEFLSVASIVFFTIYLRQKGSPESKPVDATHMETGK